MADFYLEPDDAKTLGDIEYMRKAKRIRRTFPKTAGQPEEQEINRDVSSSMLRDEKTGKISTVSAPAYAGSESTTVNFGSTFGGTDFSAPANGAASNDSPPEVKFDAAQERRRAGTSMDMFRNMAKDIRK